MEEEILKNADLIVTSTRQEVDKQYGMYRNRDLARYTVIPPGINLRHFYPYHRNMLPSVQKKDECLMAYGGVVEELNRFFIVPGQAPDSGPLPGGQAQKHLQVSSTPTAPTRSSRPWPIWPSSLGSEKTSRRWRRTKNEVLTDMLLQMDRYDLYGKMAIPKKHDFTYEVPELYRITAERKGVFVNCALVEPFGLTLIEASSCGVPIVATDDGGPRDIIHNCNKRHPGRPRGSLRPSAAPSKASWRITTSGDGFPTAASEGVHEHYNWNAHIEKYLKEIEIV